MFFFMISQQESVSLSYLTIETDEKHTYNKIMLLIVANKIHGLILLISLLEVKKLWDKIAVPTHLKWSHDYEAVPVRWSSGDQ